MSGIEDMPEAVFRLSLTLVRPDGRRIRARRVIGLTTISQSLQGYGLIGDVAKQAARVITEKTAP